MISVKGNLPETTYIAVCNHSNWRDVFILLYIDPDMKIMAAKEVLFWVGWLLYPLGCFLNRPGGIARGINRIESGWSVGVCPEGWTSLNNKMKPFYSGATVISKLTKTQIIPIRIKYDRYYDDNFCQLPDVVQWVCDFITHPFPDIEVIIGDPLPAGTSPEKLREIISNM